MNISMAICAASAGVAENQAGVALRAAHSFVHSAERVARAIVVKFRDAADRLPTRIRVAIFAGDTDWAVRVSSGFFVGLRLREILRYNHQGQHHEHEPEKSRRAHRPLSGYFLSELGYG